MLFARPTWVPIKDIRAACDSLPVSSKKPEDFLAALLYPVFRWSLTVPSGQVFKPCVHDGARDAVDSKFDEHVALQRESFLVEGQHEEAKTHGKLRTKHDRLVLPLHHLDCLCRLWTSCKDTEGFSLAGCIGLQCYMSMVYGISQPAA